MANAEPVKLLICDDSVFMRMAVRALCEAHPAIEIVGEAEDGEDAVTAARELKPDVITMDLSMPGMDGVAATQAIIQENDTSIIVLSSLTERRNTLAEKLMELGAVDAIWKSASLMDIDIDGIATTILEKILFWGSRHRETLDDAPKTNYPMKNVEERIALLSSKKNAILMTLGAGSHDRLNLVFDQLHPQSPPVILVPNVPKSCRDGFLRAVKRSTQSPVFIASDGDPLESGNIYCVFASSELAVHKKGEEIFFHSINQALAENEKQLPSIYQSLISCNIAPLCVVLSGSSAAASKQLVSTIKNVVILTEPASSCPHPEAAEFLSSTFPEIAVAKLETISVVLGRL